jgi:hypothetical protein
MPPINIPDACHTPPNAAVPAAICLTIKTAPYNGNNSSVDYFRIVHADIISEGSALVESRRNEQSKALRDILRESGMN